MKKLRHNLSTDPARRNRRRGESATTSQGRKTQVTPSEMALKIAVRSAQFVGLYAAFSMLQPVIDLSAPTKDEQPLPCS
jgi:hypothetical protein